MIICEAHLTPFFPISLQHFRRRRHQPPAAETGQTGTPHTILHCSSDNDVTQAKSIITEQFYHDTNFRCSIMGDTNGQPGLVISLSAVLMRGCMRLLNIEDYETCHSLD